MKVLGMDGRFSLLVVCVLVVVTDSAQHKDLLKYISLFIPKTIPFNPSTCATIVSNTTKTQIQELQDNVTKIIETVMRGSFKGKTYNDTVLFVDDFGARMAGSDSLNKSIEYLKAYMNDSYTNVTGEDVNIYAWERKQEDCWMILDERNQSMRITLMGGSVSTPEGGITKEVIILTSMKNFSSMASQIRDKIVLMNFPPSGYAESVQCRATCPDMAAKAGAAALLLRSSASFSMNTPHTGMIVYNVTRKANVSIPVASVTIEDADMIARLVKRNITVRIHLDVKSHEVGMVKSQNIYGELTGLEKPEELMIMAAHSDSWDIGVGAMDDAAGVFVSLVAGKLLKYLNLTTRRTIRTVIMTGEETGFWGGEEYYKKHRSEANKTSFMVEADYGTFKAKGIKSMANQNASCIVYEILQLLKNISANQMVSTYYAGADINMWQKDQVPLGNLYNEDSRYYWFHHTDADRVNVLDSDSMDSCTAVFAAVSYAVAQLQELLPRNNLNLTANTATKKAA